MLPQINLIKYRFLIRSSFFFASLIWFIAIISPCIDSYFAHINYPLLKIIYSRVCHQAPGKSFICADTHFLVCARCTGIYCSVLITSFLILFINKNFVFKTSYLIILSVPMLLDVILYSIGVYEYNKLVAFITGILFGSAVFIYILSGIENSFYQKSKIDK